MANDVLTGYSGVFNAPAKPGQFLFTMDPQSYPFLSNLSGTKITNTSKFGMGSEYDLQEFAQPSITEAGSLTAPDAVSYTRGLEENITQIYQRKVSVTYRKLADAGRLTLASADSRWPNSNPQEDEVAFQVMANAEQINGDMEKTFLIGEYAAATATNQADKTRGILEAISTNTVNAAGDKLDKTILDELFQKMADNGSRFRRPVIMTDAFNKVLISEAYGVAPRDRNVGGFNITEVVTDFGIINVIWSRYIPKGTIGVFDMDFCYLVNQPAPAIETINSLDGIIFWEQLAKTGMGEQRQLFAQTGLDYGSEKFHGKIFGLSNTPVT